MVKNGAPAVVQAMTVTPEAARTADPEAARESYGEGWPVVLAAYVAAVPSASVGA